MKCSLIHFYYCYYLHYSEIIILYYQSTSTGLQEWFL